MAAIAAAPVSDPSAGARLSELFEAHGRMVYGLCRVLLRDPVEAEDAAQETFLAAYGSLAGGNVPREPAAWLAAIARNECRDRIRARMRAPLELVEEDGAAPTGLDAAADQRAEVRALCAALGELPAPQRQAIVLREFYGLSYEEAAVALGVSHSALQSLLFRARQRLQDTLRPARKALGGLTVPPTLREALAGSTPGFAPAATVATAASGGGAGLVAATVAKLAAGPVAAKVAALTAAATVTVGGAAAVTGFRVDPADGRPPAATVAAPAADRRADAPSPVGHTSPLPAPVPRPPDVRDAAAEPEPVPAAGDEGPVARDDVPPLPVDEEPVEERPDRPHAPSVAHEPAQEHEPTPASELNDEPSSAVPESHETIEDKPSSVESEPADDPAVVAPEEPAAVAPREDAEPIASPVVATP
jgi:RNA polymerase sigma factor (sigma-70 family)